MVDNTKILLVDDDAVFTMIHRMLLEKAGFNVHPDRFQNGEEVIAFLRGIQEFKNHFLIFLDLNMPILDGWQVLKYLNSFQHKEFIQVIIISSSVDKADRKKAELYQFVIDFIEKPITLNYLMSLKDKVIGI